MELYHIHTLGNHDEIYEVDNEIVVSPYFYNNRLLERIMNTRSAVATTKYPESYETLTSVLAVSEYTTLTNEIGLSHILEVIATADCSLSERRDALLDAKRIIQAMDNLKRENALEEYRKTNCPSKPSRLHSLFACSKEGIKYWTNFLNSENLDIYRIDPYDTVFHTNERLLPYEESSYRESYALSSRYYNPKEKDFNLYQDEYLIQGRVRLLEKVDEVRVLKRQK